MFSLGLRLRLLSNRITNGESWLNNRKLPEKFMNRTVYTFIVVAATIVVMLSIQGVWHHFRPAATARGRQVAQKPLTGQAAADAQQAARDFFNAMRDGDWATVSKFWPKNVPKGKTMDDIFNDRVKKLVSGLEIVSIGAPYKESGSGWTMIPYEVRFNGSGSQSNNLRMEKEPDGQWIWGGGF
jgi:hypothetical protein